MSSSHPPLETVELRVEGMDCPDEIAQLEDVLQDRPGIEELAFNLMRSRMTVRSNSALTDSGRIIELVSTTGMSATVSAGGDSGADAGTLQSRGRLWMTILAGVGTAVGLASSWLPTARIHHMPWPAAIAYTLAIIAAWRYVAPKALGSIKARRLDMNVLMTVAVAGAVALGEWFEASTVAFLFMVSNLLESWSVGRARQAIHALMELSPAQARLYGPDGSEALVDTAQVRVGERVAVRPGEKFPLDGRVATGSTRVNQAPITGESLPVSKDVGDEVYAGTVNQDGAVVIEVTKPADDTVLAGVIRLVEQAQARKSPAERFVDRFAAYYTPAVIIGAVVLCVAGPLISAAPVTEWIYRSLVLLVIACPCALVISTPVTVVSGLTAAARRGVLIKGGQYLESVGRASAIALDKTGTLTLGRPVVEEVIPLNETREQELLQLAAAIEQRSEHAIAEAIVDYARRRDVIARPCEQYLAIPGKGARATIDGKPYLIGNHRLLEEHGLCSQQIHQVMIDHEDCHHTAVAVCSADTPLGVFLLADALREEAKATVAELHRAGVDRVVMLTGDNAGTAEAIATALGAVEFRAELLPADKVRVIEELKGAGSGVVMVGDGINDAPALAAADIGIAMGTVGTDAALETADVALMTDDLAKLPWLMRHSRRTRAIITQNIALSLAIKVVFVALAIPGWANLWMAIAADMGASLLVTFNGLRLLRLSGASAGAEKVSGRVS
ncbi:MAG: heavy metal translocating P-type ATPase [Planctomycetota bacterium]|jgi:Cd2+/Zn2+-exporting ATPase